MAHEEVFLEANGIRFRALAAGPLEGPLVLLLHGFPELAISWRHQLPALAQAGYRAVAPDMRGYGGTDKRGPFDFDTLAKDVAGLVRALGRDQAVIVGHDWGGGVAWAAAFRQSAVVERLVVLNCPHPAVLARDLFRNPRQLARSWYMFFFQIPFLPERLLTRDHAANVARALRGGAFVKEAFRPDELEPYRANFDQPGAASGALGYYRSAFRSALGMYRRAKANPVTAKTLIIWGARDRFLGRELLEPQKNAPFFAPGNLPEIQFIGEAGHFVQNEAPEKVNAALLEWLGRG